MDGEADRMRRRAPFRIVWMPESQSIVIPPMPATMAAALKFDIDAPLATVAQLHDIIAPDRVMTAEILRIANSSFYGRSGKFRTLRDAITFLGLRAVKNLAVFMSLKRMASGLRGRTLRKYLQEYPVVTGLIAQDLIKPLGASVRQDEAFLGGLFNRFGMTVLALQHRIEYARLVMNLNDGDSLSEAETLALGTDHVAIGSVLCEQWKLPTQYVPVVLGSDDMKSSPLVPLTTVAGYVGKQLIGIPLSPGEESKIQLALGEYQKSPEALTSFDDAYLRMLKAHPYYREVAN